MLQAPIVVAGHKDLEGVGLVRQPLEKSTQLVAVAAAAGIARAQEQIARRQHELIVALMGVGDRDDAQAQPPKPLASAGVATPSGSSATVASRQPASVRTQRSGNCTVCTPMVPLST
jgi:hypothetical protein